MKTLDFNSIFKDAFDTFKVFETIPIEISGVLVEGHATTIWQTLNHLVIWRKFQIQQLTNINTIIKFTESDSWITETTPSNLIDWEEKINEFHQQTIQLNNCITKLDLLDVNLHRKLKILLDTSTHLSFHLGEIILIARQKESYPKPSKMHQFLNN